MQIVSVSDREFLIAAAAGYGLATLCAIFLWRAGFRKESRACFWIMGLSFLAHTIAMLQRGLAEHRCPVRNLYEATSFVAWAIVAAQFALRLMPRLRFISAFAAPVVFWLSVFALMPGLDRPHQPRSQLQVVMTSLHAALALSAYGAFGISALASVMFLVQERDLKLCRVRVVTSALPPIDRLNAIAGTALAAGVVTLGIGLGLGALLSPPEGVAYLNDAKVLWSLLVWTLYLAVLMWRWGFAQTGRRFAIASVGAFAFIILTFWCTNLLSRIHNP